MNSNIPLLFGPYGKPALLHADRLTSYGANACWFHMFDAWAFETCARHGLVACVEFKTFRADFDRRPELIPIGVDGKPIRYGKLVQGICLSQQHFLEQIEADLPPLYAASDLLVWPCINEAIGMAILEAQAAGLPAVVADVGAVSTLVSDALTGFRVREGDARAFRRAVATYLGLSGEVQRCMARVAVSKVGAFHELDYAAAQLDRVLAGAIARAKARRR